MSFALMNDNDSEYRAPSYVSSPEFERGLLANQVAKRCALVDNATDRELIWFVQYLSHHQGGLAAVARDLIARHPERIRTNSMQEIAKGPSEIYTAEEVRKIRMDLPYGRGETFPLKGETEDELWALRKKKTQADRFKSAAKRLADLKKLADLNKLDCETVADDSYERLFDEESRQVDEERQREVALKHPSDYPASCFHELCTRAANQGLDGYRHCDDKTLSLDREMAAMCQSPEWDFATGGPWYFPRLVETLREYQADFVKSKSVGLVVTELGKKVADELDYTLSEKVLTLFQGDARTGKSFSARAWCEQHPGAARFVEVPPGCDERGLFHSIARGLGLGNFTSYSPREILERVEAVLLTGDLMLVLDEAQRLWPQKTTRRSGEGKRIVWVMKWANEKVPIAMIATPQFIQMLDAIEKGGWNSAQLTGRLSNYVRLPAALALEDLKAVAKSVLPEADDQTLRALAAYAQGSARYLAAIDSISKRARWLAQRSGRKTVTVEDVRKAMQESVIPADTKLQIALSAGKKARTHRLDPEPLLPANEEAENLRNRVAEPAMPAPRRANLTQALEF